MSSRAAALQADDGSRYANRVPQRQSLYDWAPRSSDEHLYQELISRGMIPNFAPSALPQSRHPNFDSPQRQHGRFRVPSPDLTANRALEPESRRGESQNGVHSSAQTMADILEAMEQHRRLNARSRSTLQSYLVDRDQRNNAAAPNSSWWARRHGSEQPWFGSPYPSRRSVAEQSDLQDAYHEWFLDNPSLTRLKDSICYLSKLRHCSSLEEGLQLAAELAIDSACVRGQKSALHRFTKLSNLIVDTSTLSSVAECSWLTPGTVFTGSQHTPSGPIMVRANRERDHYRDPDAPSRLGYRRENSPEQALHDQHRRRSYTRISASRHPPPVPHVAAQHGGFDPHHSSTPGQSTVDPASQPGQPCLSPSSDHWPVAVTLHDVSFADLTLSGTMSATHIPDKISPQSPLHNPQGSSMQSFFEGEIIDFKTNTLETEKFDTGDPDGEGMGIGRLGTDARYWRGVGPFRELLNSDRARRRERGNAESKYDAEEDVVEDAQGGEDLIASHLRSRTWVEEVLLKEWVLMRWKERCFIKSTDGAADTTRPGGSSSTAINDSTDPAACGLTISGFYYVALRRRTGEIEGLYHDPGSLPFQVLGLRPEEPGASMGRTIGVKKRWPVQQFR